MTLRKMTVILMVFITVFSLFSCGGKKYRIAVVTDGSDIDGDSVSRYAWDGATAYAEKHNVSCAYYKASKADTEALEDAVSKAVSGGAELVLLTGGVFGPVAYKVQTEYPDVCFVLLDGQSSDGSGNVFYTAQNTACAVFEEKDAGFAAGYALVSDGVTAIGFVGGSYEYCSGFLQGADKAAAALGLQVRFEVCFTSDEDGADEIKAKSEEMFVEGVDVIMADGDRILKPVKEAAGEKNGRLIGTNTDKRYYSERVITTAVKNYAYVSELLVEAFFENRFAMYAGRTTLFGRDNGGTGLPTKVNSDSNGNAFDRFASFTVSDYRDLCDKMASGIYNPIYGAGIEADGADIVGILHLTNSTRGFAEETDGE